MLAPRSACRCCRSASRSKWTRSSPSAAEALLAAPAGFAHRGLHGPGVPENSLGAFRAAISAGAGIECDLRLSRDGRAMIFHDSTLQRMCEVEGKAEALESSQLGELRLGRTREKVPPLTDLLALAQATPLLLELKKGAGPMEPLCAEVHRAIRQHLGRCGVMSFDAAVGQWFAANAPDVPRGLVIDQPSPPLREEMLEVARPDFIAVSVRSATESWVTELRAAGMPVGCWTVRTAAERRQVAVHADALIWEGDGRP